MADFFVPGYESAFSWDHDIDGVSGTGEFSVSGPIISFTAADNTAQNFEVYYNQAWPTPNAGPKLLRVYYHDDQTGIILRWEGLVGPGSITSTTIELIMISSPPFIISPTEDIGLAFVFYEPEPSPPILPPTTTTTTRRCRRCQQRSEYRRMMLGVFIVTVVFALLIFITLSHMCSPRSAIN